MKSLLILRAWLCGDFAILCPICEMECAGVFKFAKHLKFGHEREAAQQAVRDLKSIRIVWWGYRDEG